MNTTITPEALQRAMDAACQAGEYAALPNRVYDALIAGWIELQASQAQSRFAVPEFAPAILAVIAELQRATHKFPTWPTDPLHAVAIVGEEFGELNKAVLQCTYEPQKSGLDEVREEATQTAAMALRFLASLNKYVYAGSAQHLQEPIAAAPAPEVR